MEEVNLGIGKFIFGARPCDTCHSAAALLFCQVDSLFLCFGCDSKVHTPHARHERVWMCEVCEHAPAMVTCKADSAVLCAACDLDIHSANPLARRHERVPVVPFLDTAAAVVAKSSATAANGFVDDVANCPHTCFIGDETATLAQPSWGFTNATTKLEMDTPEMKSVDFLFSDSDQFLEFDCNGTDSVVPVQTMKSYEEATALQVINQLSNKYVEIDFTGSKFNPFNPNPNFGQPISQSISSSSMDVGIVPDGNSMSDTSYAYVQTSGSTVNRSGSNTTTLTQGSDREAKVMRYREKRKNRKFEKTIRYASRKAYAETRPRIKGRFAKRSEIELGIENKMFVPISPSFVAEEIGYSIVPSF